jgi:eukaryotic-like serine/threonine-protein kinase
MADQVRFGSFDLDLEAAELRNNGRNVRLPEQQFQILQMLLLEEGGVVSREEIRSRLWPKDTVVEFDRSINAAIMKLRIALGDTGDKPRYIETLVRRGYRLVVPVEWQRAKPPAGTARDAGSGTLVGRKVSHYRVLGILGGGGMGLVYKGEDLKLDRPVALKFLPEEIAADPVAVRRFEREARTASSLNHPNICTIYEVEEHEAQPFIVMELLEGESLRELIARMAESTREGRRGLPLAQLLDIAAQIAEGLNAAHEKSIIHRDIKPANIFVTPSGRVKVLDFGLAKATREKLPEPMGESEDQNDATRSSPDAVIDQTMTWTGKTMGTAGYMSPEQVRGEKLDARSDLYSFGLVLYEMVTGALPVRRERSGVGIEAILYGATFPPTPLNADVPAALEQIVAKALENDRDLRYQHASEMRADLLRLKRDMDSGRASAGVDTVSPGLEIASAQPAVAAGTRRMRLWLLLAITAGVLVLEWFLRPTLPPPEVTGTTQLTHDNRSKTFVGKLLPLLNDGTRIYFTEQDFAGMGFYEVSTDGGDAELLKVPTLGELRGISPLRPQLLLQGFDGGLWTVVVPGGQPHRIGNLVTDDAAWAPDGKTLYFARNHSIFSAAPDGSGARKLLTVEGDPAWMRFSPDGRVLRFTVIIDRNQGNQGLVSLWQAQADGSHLHQLLPGFTNPASDCCGSWTPDGRYFVFHATRDGNPALWATREGGDWWHKVNHAPVRLTQVPTGAYAPLPARDGKVYFVGIMHRGELTRYDPKTRSLSPFLGGLSATGVSYSKDGKHLVFVSYPDNELWYGNSDGSSFGQLTFPPMQNVQMPHISPDGSQIAFSADIPGKPRQIYVIPVEGGDAEAITSGSSGGVDPFWSPSGDSLLYGPTDAQNTTNEPNALQIVNLKTRAVTAIPNSSGLFSPKWSPDGSHLVAITRGAIPRLKLYDMNLHTWQNLTGEFLFEYPEWTPDSRCVVFNAQTGGAVWQERVCLADRKMQPIANMSASGRLVEAVGSWQWTSLAPDGSILALRDTSTEEIYALDVNWP